jgi:hypothetical protein
VAKRTAGCSTVVTSAASPADTDAVGVGVGVPEDVPELEGVTEGVALALWVAAEEGEGAPEAVDVAEGEGELRVLRDALGKPLSDAERERDTEARAEAVSEREGAPLREAAAVGVAVAVGRSLRVAAGEALPLPLRTVEWVARAAVPLGASGAVAAALPEAGPGVGVPLSRAALLPRPLRVAAGTAEVVPPAAPTPPVGVPPPAGVAVGGAEGGGMPVAVGESADAVGEGGDEGEAVVAPLREAAAAVGESTALSVATGGAEGDAGAVRVSLSCAGALIVALPLSGALAAGAPLSLLCALREAVAL